MVLIIVNKMLIVIEEGKLILLGMYIFSLSGTQQDTYSKTPLFLVLRGELL